MAPALATVLRGEMGKVSDTCAPRADIPHAMHMQCDILLRGTPLTGQDVVAGWKEARRLLSLLRTHTHTRREAQERIPSVSFASESTARKEADD